jgi:hypothetical protein
MYCTGSLARRQRGPRCRRAAAAAAPDRPALCPAPTSRALVRVRVRRQEVDEVGYAHAHRLAQHRRHVSLELLSGGRSQVHQVALQRLRGQGRGGVAGWWGGGMLTQGTPGGLNAERMANRRGWGLRAIASTCTASRAGQQSLASARPGRMCNPHAHSSTRAVPWARKATPTVRLPAAQSWVIGAASPPLRSPPLPPMGPWVRAVYQLSCSSTLSSGLAAACLPRAPLTRIRTAPHLDGDHLQPLLAVHDRRAVPVRGRAPGTGLLGAGAGNRLNCALGATGRRTVKVGRTAVSRRAPAGRHAHGFTTQHHVTASPPARPAHRPARPSTSTIPSAGPPHRAALRRAALHRFPNRPPAPPVEHQEDQAAFLGILGDLVQDLRREQEGGVGVPPA